MQHLPEKIQSGSIARLYRSFSPASRAVLWFALPLTLLDAVHYYTAGTALAVSLPLLAAAYLLCGGLAARFHHQDGLDPDRMAAAGRVAGLRLWLISTLINSLVAIAAGIASLGVGLLTSSLYLCLFGPLHALGSLLAGWLGGWIYQQYIQRTTIV